MWIITASKSHDVPDVRLEAMTFYLSHLKVPTLLKKSKPKVSSKASSYPEYSVEDYQMGKRLFERVGCAKCHISQLKTADNLIISPYSDLLLHDMGDELADNTYSGKATKNEWRTTPLWGIGLYEKVGQKKPRFLHDGRAQTLEEAILWHNGEAKTTKQNFAKLNKTQRTQLIQFLKRL